MPGKFLYIADYLSRNFQDTNQSGEIPELNELVHALNISNEKKIIYKQATSSDVILGKIRKYLIEGWPSRKKEVDADCKFYWKFLNDLILDDDLIFLNDRIIVPTSLRIEVLNQLHQSHLDIEKNKRRARSLVYWPGINSDIENKITTCIFCQKFRNANVKNEMISHEIPTLPFQKIGMDIFEFDKKDVLVIADYYSKFLDILTLTNKTANQVITKLKTVFCTHGIPKQIIADNMSFG